MKTSIDYLPKNKQDELKVIVPIMCTQAKIEIIILFGSYARNDWVEEKYDDTHYRYQSDFDLLLIVAEKSEFKQSRIEHSVEANIESCNKIKTPVSIIVHDIEFVNRRLRKGQYFFTDIKREGVMLYDSGKYQLSEVKNILPEERKKLAKCDFKYWFEKANNFKEGFEFYLNQEKYNEAAFLLHQTVERLYSGIILVFTRYKPNTHDLATLRKLANTVDHQLIEIFPIEKSEDKHLFKLLRKAYVDARYKPSYTITKEELISLVKQADLLKEIGERICKEKINSFTDR